MLIKVNSNSESFINSRFRPRQTTGFVERKTSLLVKATMKY